MDEFSESQGYEAGGRFVCTCGKVYRNKGTLNRHLRYECGKDAMFSCPFCPRKCKRKSNMLQHIRTRHSEFMPGEMPTARRKSVDLEQNHFPDVSFFVDSDTSDALSLSSSLINFRAS
ncbi:unnamed protein product [Bemisia tabaci]|uniref:C2H2-type domain-containing protein n=1 Tax=Bemisia tabaci TaxID=7038 RepID=A0A9N9ZXH0_BEMTA|nr:unnamed protein product [Bemisia tabaci]